MRFCFNAQIASAYGLRDSRVETDKGKKPGKGAESITKVDTLAKTRFRKEHPRRHEESRSRTGWTAAVLAR